VLQSPPPKREPVPDRGSLAVRAAALGVVAAVLFGVLLFRLWALQVLHSEQYVAQAVQNDLRTIAVPAPRGVVYDRKGRVLVTNHQGLAAEINPNELPDGPPPEGTGCRAQPELRGCRVLARVAWVLGLRRRYVWAKYQQALRINPVEPVTIDGSIAKSQVYYMRERKPRFPGVQFEQTFEREYPFGPLAPNVLGQVGRISASDLADPNFRGLSKNTTVGHAGIEYVYDRELRGEDGQDQQSYDASGRPVGKPYLVRAPQQGDDLRLSIDARLQRIAQEAIRYGIRVAHGDGETESQTGAIVAMNPKTGAIYALASWPTYNPSIFVPPYHGYTRVVKNPLTPLYDRSIAGSYPPGSTFKPVTASAAWQSGLIAPGSQLLCSGVYYAPGDTSHTPFHNWNPGSSSWMGLQTALEQSCDTFFYRLGDAFYRRHDQEFQHGIRRFGFGAPAPIDLRGAGAGRVPDPHWKAGYYTDPIQRLWLPGDDITMAIGQGDLLVTPLQMAVAYSAIANGGHLVTPHVADTVVDDNGRVVKRIAPRPRRDLGLSPELLAEIRQGLYEAAHSPNGTSSAVFGKFLPVVAGKTGTAENPPRDDHAWYAGFAPMDNPKLVVVALIANGGHGGVAAAPAALRVFQAYFHPGQRLKTVVGVDQSR
jgi:penicillin-binding protein 2